MIFIQDWIDQVIPSTSRSEKLIGFSVQIRNSKSFFNDPHKSSFSWSSRLQLQLQSKVASNFNHKIMVGILSLPYFHMASILFWSSLTFHHRCRRRDLTLSSDRLGSLQKIIWRSWWAAVSRYKRSCCISRNAQKLSQDKYDTLQLVESWFKTPNLPYVRT